MPAPDARALDDLSAEFRAFLAVWDKGRRCPLPLVDFLLEHGLESQAEAARWCAGGPTNPVFDPSPGERGGECGPYPSKMGRGWMFRPLASGERCLRPHRVPGITEDIEVLTPIDAILAMLDAWRV